MLHSIHSIDYLWYMSLRGNQNELNTPEYKIRPIFQTVGTMN